MKVPNLMQQRQDAFGCNIQVEGVDSINACLTGIVTLNKVWVGLCRTTQLNELGYARRAVEMQGQTFEEGVVAAFLNLHFKLVRLEVEIHESDETRGWGVCKWSPAHANYLLPVHEYAQECAFPAALFHAMFETEHAGDQHFSLFGDRLHREGVRLLPKSLIYRTVVFARPEGEQYRDLNRRVRYSPNDDTRIPVSLG